MPDGECGAKSQKLARRQIAHERSGAEGPGFAFMGVADAIDEAAKLRLRFDKAVPAIFPASVLIHARGRPMMPPQPRLAVESYWRHHTVRADRLARAAKKQDLLFYQYSRAGDRTVRLLADDVVHSRRMEL